MEPRRIYDYRSPHCQPHRTAASDPGYRSLRAFYWSNVKGRWTTFGTLGRMKLMLESAHEIVESDPMFRIPRGR
jgi:hypothetical protein